MVEPAERLIVALDLPDIASAREMVTALGDDVIFYKIGYQLAFAGGLEFARELKRQGKKVFVDLKLLDIENTVEKGVASLLSIGADMLTIHAYPAAMKAAVSAAAGSPLCLLAVTVLTSMNDADLKEAGYASNAAELVEKRVRQAVDCGMGGVVCSAHEAARVRAIIGPGSAIVTPGIRPAGAQSGEQKRIMTPAKAIEAGASHLVVGRPITAAIDPREAAATILDEIRQTNRN